jgi:hypothetical protein
VQVPRLHFIQRTWEQGPLRHCGIPSRWEEGAPAPGAEPRLGSFLSQSRCFLFPLGAQLGKQGVFSVPLDPPREVHPGVGRTGGAVRPVRIKKNGDLETEETSCKILSVLIIEVSGTGKFNSQATDRIGSPEN